MTSPPPRQSTPHWPRLGLADLDPATSDPFDPQITVAATAIVAAVRCDGDRALRDYASKFDQLPAGTALCIERTELAAAAAAIPSADLALLQRCAERIANFARAQRAALREVEVPVDGGRASHTVVALERAGCYAPGGRYPLPSSVLMTAITARIAGVESVTVATPNPAPIMLAAAAVAGADRLLRVGGAQAIAALAFGTETLPRCDAVVGPGNQWVTAAKLVVAGHVRTDGVAGPSELVVIADSSADPELIAADLLAQAEHDPAARPFLITPEPAIIDATALALTRQLATLPTADIAAAALRNGGAVLVDDLDAAAMASDRLAPEHVELAVRTPRALAARLRHYGAVFLGGHSAEVFGDYGVGPNHVLPTGGAARHQGGLSVFDFLRVRTQLELDFAPADLVDDCARLAELEGLPGHARAARHRAP